MRAGTHTAVHQHPHLLTQRVVHRQPHHLLIRQRIRPHRRRVGRVRECIPQRQPQRRAGRHFHRVVRFAHPVPAHVGQAIRIPRARHHAPVHELVVRAIRRRAHAVETMNLHKRAGRIAHLAAFHDPVEVVRFALRCPRKLHHLPHCFRRERGELHGEGSLVPQFNREIGACNRAKAHRHIRVVRQFCAELPRGNRCGRDVIHHVKHTHRACAQRVADAGSERCCAGTAAQSFHQ